MKPQKLNESFLIQKKLTTKKPICSCQKYLSFANALALIFQETVNIQKDVYFKATNQKTKRLKFSAGRAMLYLRFF